LTSGRGHGPPCPRPVQSVIVRGVGAAARSLPIMVSKNDLISALPMRGLRADVGTKSSRKGGAMGIVDLEVAAVFQSANEVPDSVFDRFEPFVYPELVPMCFDSIVRGVKVEFRVFFGPELPALRVVVREVLPHPVETNELNNYYVGRKIVRQALIRLDPDISPHP
jgi:hypothetical protein